jgi:hypothetical protein
VLTGGLHQILRRTRTPNGFVARGKAIRQANRGSFGMNMVFKAGTALLALTMAPAAEAATYVIGPITATGSGGQGSPDNSVIAVTLAAGANITSIRYAMTMTASGDSYLSDMAILFGTTEESTARFRPAFDLPTGGTIDLAGTADLIDMGLDFFLLDDGVLRLEFLDTYNGGEIPARALWTDTSFEITYDAAMGAVPEPSSWALMILGFGALGGRVRQRRAVAALAA